MVGSLEYLFSFLFTREDLRYDLFILYIHLCYISQQFSFDQI